MIARSSFTGFLSLVLVAALTAPTLAQINLSDIVAGGDGRGLGWTQDDDIDFGGDKYAAVNLDNGTFMTRLEVDGFHNGTVDTDGVNPSPCEGAPFSDPTATGDVPGGEFIDSVFFLPNLTVPLNSAGITFPYKAGDEWGNSWNHVLSNRTHDIDKGREDIFAGGSANWETGIGIHASAGITFDLDAIREEHGAENVHSFSTFIGADRCGALINFYVIFSDDEGIIDDPNGTEIFVVGDPFLGQEELNIWVRASNPTSAAQYIAPIPEGAKYLTLTVGAGGNGIGCDHGVLANPQIRSATPPTPVENLTCMRNEDGDFDLTWDLPDNVPPDPIKIRIGDEEVGEVPNDATSFTLSAGDTPPGDFLVCIDNGSPFPACCRPAATDDNGLIKNWLALGPFANDFGCSGPDPEPLLGNHIAPTKIGCEYPDAGDPIEYDSFEAASNAYVGPGEVPEWRVFDDGALDGTQNMQAEAVNNGWQNDDVMTWLVTYVTYQGAEAVVPDLCIGSDDGVQVWIDERLVWTNNACRGVGVCQDLILGADIGLVLEPGPHRIAIAAWERGGGWGATFALQVDGLPVLDGDPDWIFHGTSRPEGLMAEEDCGDSECVELRVTPTEATVGIDQQLSLNVTCFDEAGLPTNVTGDAEYSAEPAGIVSIDEMGVVTGLALGEAEITVSIGDLSETVNVRVARLLSLADMVAGGDGTGPGGSIDSEFAGINLDTGVFMSRLELDGFNMGTTDTDGINPSPVDASDFVDSVFFLNAADVTITTEMIEVFWELGDEWGNSWNHVLSNFTHDIDKGNEDIYAGGRNTWTTGIGIHASAGVTFDLGAIRDEHGEEAVKELSVFLGKDRCGGNMSMMVIFSNADGVIEDPLAEELNPPPIFEPLAYVRVPVSGDEGQAYLGEIPPEATHLTLAVGANGDGIGCAHGVFADPVIIGEGGPVGTTFIRGDVTADGDLNITDAVRGLGIQFLGDQPVVDCLEIQDVNDDGVVNITDPIASLGFQFLGGPAPSAPFPTCGPDPEGSADSGCASFPPCN